jgi:hypothetical protein
MLHVFELFYAEGITAISQGLQQNEFHEILPLPLVTVNVLHRPSNKRTVRFSRCRGRNGLERFRPRVPSTENIAYFSAEVI